MFKVCTRGAQGTQGILGIQGADASDIAAQGVQGIRHSGVQGDTSILGQDGFQGVQGETAAGFQGLPRWQVDLYLVQVELKSSL